MLGGEGRSTARSSSLEQWREAEREMAASAREVGLGAYL